MEIFSFLSGVVIGVAGQYFADKYTDQRQKRESENTKRRLFHQMETEMPSLIAEMKEDFSKPEHASYREFIVTRCVLLARDIPECLGYFEEDHLQIRNFVTVLENNGFIMSVSDDEPKQYRLKEDFVQWLKKRT